MSESELRERLRAFQEERAVEERCCYCGETAAEGLMEVPADGGLPGIWHCRELGTCDGRLAQQIVALAQRAQTGERSQ